jgi:hypothetical protein
MNRNNGPDIPSLKYLDRINVIFFPFVVSLSNHIGTLRQVPLVPSLSRGQGERGISNTLYNKFCPGTRLRKGDTYEK